MKTIGFLLVLIGAIALAYKGISYTRQRTVFEVGGLEAKVDERKTIPLSPILGVTALTAGIVLILVKRRPA
jgi:hypothetical protein